jgi:hypothetical protein
MDLDLDPDPHKDLAEAAMAGVMMAEKTPAAAAMLEVEMTTCHRGSTNEGTKARLMGEGEAHAGQARSRGHGEDREHTASDAEACWGAVSIENVLFFAHLALLERHFVARWHLLGRFKLGDLKVLHQLHAVMIDLLARDKLQLCKI